MKDRAGANVDTHSGTGEARIRALITYPPFVAGGESADPSKVGLIKATANQVSGYTKWFNQNFNLTGQCKPGQRIPDKLTAVFPRDVPSVDDETAVLVRQK